MTKNYLFSQKKLLMHSLVLVYAIILKLNFRNKPGKMHLCFYLSGISRFCLSKQVNSFLVSSRVCPQDMSSEMQRNTTCLYRALHVRLTKCTNNIVKYAVYSIDAPKQIKSELQVGWACAVPAFQNCMVLCATALFFGPSTCYR